MSEWDHPYSNRAWNSMVAQAIRDTPVDGRHTTIRQTSRGKAIDYTGGQWQHPWTIEPFWNEDQWCAKIIPGVVNGHDPAIDMAATDLPTDARVYGNGYKSATRIDGPMPVKLQVLLTDTPTPFLRINQFSNPIAVTYENGVPVKGSYPDFFRLIGVQAPEEPDPTITDVLKVIGGGDLPSTVVPIFPVEFGDLFLLRADVVLTVDRPAAISDTIEDAFGNTLLSGVKIVPPSFDRYGARLTTVSKYNPLILPTMLDRLLGSAVDPTFEQILVGTIYFVSPPKPGDATKPDESWQPYVLHNLYWNLDFASVAQFDHPPDQPLTLVTGLAFGIADPIFAALLAPINDLTSAALAALDKTNVQGIFWTAG